MALRGWLAAGALLALAAGCGDDAGGSDAGPTDGAAPDGSTDDCIYALDGECDEPVNCALGTDTTDCEAACAEESEPHLHAAACAHRQPEDELRDPPPDPPAVPSGGGLHETGHRLGKLLVPSGFDADSMVPRHYLLYVPASYDPERPSPVLVVMPGHRVGIHNQPAYTATLRTADLHDILVVYAEQEFRRQGREPQRWAFWTDWPWGETDRENPDLIFLRELVERIGDEYNIDRTRVYASGHSRGAAMALIAAFELQDVFAGALVESGFTEFDYLERIAGWDGDKPTLFFFHGIADPDVPVGRTDRIVSQLRDDGFTDDELRYERLTGVTHRWQPYLNEVAWAFLASRPLPEERVSR